MAVAYQVQAQVVDLRGDTPKPTDRFWVDTNVWFWTVYSRVGLSPSPPQSYQTHDYPVYLKAALRVGADLRWSGLSFSELAHRVERTEFDIYRQTLAGAQLTERQFKGISTQFPSGASTGHAGSGNGLANSGEHGETARQACSH